MAQAIPVDGKFIGLYFGIVHEHVVEPDGRSLGKVRVICPVLYQTGVSPECFPATGVGGGGFTDPNGTTHPCGLYAVPPIGSTVIIGLSGGDADFPIYLGGWWGSPNGNLEVPSSPNQTLPKGAPGVVVWQTDKWRIFIEDGAVPKLRFELVGSEDTNIELDGTTEKVKIESQGTAHVEIDGAAGGRIDIKGGDIRLADVGAIEKLLLGSTFLTFFNAHVHGGVTVGAGASGTPATPLVDATHLSQKVKTG